MFAKLLPEPIQWTQVLSLMISSYIIKTDSSLTQVIGCFSTFKAWHIDGLVQKRHDSSALAMELRLSYPLICYTIVVAMLMQQDVILDIVLSIPYSDNWGSNFRLRQAWNEFICWWIEFWVLIQNKDTILPV